MPHSLRTSKGLLASCGRVGVYSRQSHAGQVVRPFTKMALHPPIPQLGLPQVPAPALLLLAPLLADRTALSPRRPSVTTLTGASCGLAIWQSFPTGCVSCRFRGANTLSGTVIHTLTLAKDCLSASHVDPRLGNSA